MENNGSVVGWLPAAQSTVRIVRPSAFRWGLRGLVVRCLIRAVERATELPKPGQVPPKCSGPFSLASAQSCRTASALNSITGKRVDRTTLEDQSCVLRLDPLSSESGRMKFKPHMRRSSQHELDPGTGGCVSQRIRVPLDTECSVSHAVTDAVRGLTSIYMIGLGLLCPEPCHPDIKD